jgi:hypothetical protein
MVTAEERDAILKNRYVAVNKRRNPTAQYDEVVTSSGGGSSSSGCSTARGEGGVFGMLGRLAVSLTIMRRRRWR